MIAIPRGGFPGQYGRQAEANERAPSLGFTFRFPVGILARQILESGRSFPCRLIVVTAPDDGFSQANLLSIFYAIGSSASVLDESSELPPGSSETIHIDDVNKLWFIAQNTTDIVFGRVEA